MGSSTQQQNSTQNTSWTPADLQQLMTGVNAAGGALSQSQANTTTPTAFTATMTPQQLQQYQELVSNANSVAPGVLNATGLGAGAVSTGTGALSNAITGYGGFNPASTNNAGALNTFANNYTAGQNIPAQVQNAMLAGEQTARDVINPGIESGAANTGNINSSRTGIAEGLVDRGLAEQAAGLSGTLQANANATGANLGESALTSNNAATLASLTGMAGAGSGLAGTGQGLLSSGVNNIGTLGELGITGAGGNQINTQEGLQNQLQAAQYGETNPFTSVDQYLGALGSVNVGGSGVTNSNSTTTSTPSFGATLASLLGAGGSLLGSSGVSSGPYAGMGGSGLLGAGINPFSFLKGPFALGA